MQLTGQTNGNTYRLRNARFDVTGPQNITLDSETDLTLTTLTATLSTGDYTINLEPGWSLERLDAGNFDVVDATLTSANPRPFQILGGGTTNVAYQFSTSGMLVTIGTGTLDVSIEVTETGMMGTGGSGGTGTGACTLVPQSGCPMGQGCYFDGNSGLTGQCAPSGTIPIGGMSCMAINDCVAGALCASTDQTNPNATACFQLCDTTNPSSCPAGQSCVDLQLGGLGACLAQ
jgi:hypothetical protein